MRISLSLHEAIKKRDIQKVRDVLATGVNINERGYYNYDTPLYTAIRVGDVNILKLLISAGADLTLKHYSGRTPLQEFLQYHCDLEIFKVLLDADAGDVNVKDQFGQSALHRAVRNNNKAMVEYLSSRGADVNIVDKYFYTPLHVAAGYNKTESHKEIIEILLKNGASVNAQNGSGSTPLHELLLLGNPTIELVKLFLEFKADVNLKNRYNQNSLHRVRSNNQVNANLDILQILIDYGSDVNCVSSLDESTPLHRFCYCKKSFKYLLKSGANIEALDFKGYTPAMQFLTSIIKSAESFKSLLFLLKYADVNKVALDGTTILKFKHKPDVWEIFLDHFAKLQAINVRLQESIHKTISNREDYKSYFEQCAKELQIAKDTKLQNSWITFFDLLVDNKRKLKNYAGNQDLIEDFEKSDCQKKFPIYGASMQKNVAKGIKRRELFDRSTDLLSDSLPIFNPMHLVIRDVLDCIGSTKDLLKLSKRNSRELD